MKKTKPNCFECANLAYNLHGRWVCCETDKALPLRKTRRLARTCPHFRFWVDAFIRPTCVVISPITQEKTQINQHITEFKITSTLNPEALA